METVEYAPGRVADVVGDRGRPTVLMWHGAQRDARTTMRPLADRLAGRGCCVVVPDWDSHAEDRGRADLMGSFQFARANSTDPDAIVLVGWSLGGVAAAGLTIQAHRLDVRVAHTVCLAGAFMAIDPISGEHLPSDLHDYRDRAPFTLLHGVDDAVVPVAATREFAAVLMRNAWPVEIAELRTDHAAIAGATYDIAADRYLPALDPRSLDVADEVASQIVDTADLPQI